MSGVKDLNHYYYLDNIFKNINYDLPNNQNFKKPSSLESFVAIKIAILLWRSRDVVDMDMSVNKLKKFDQIIDKVLEKVSHLEITHNCKREVKEVIPRIGKEIESFLKLQMGKIPFINLKIYWNNLYFNQNGNIDINKTFKRVIEYSNLDLTNKFFLACNNCFVDKIEELQVKLPESFVNDKILNAPLLLGIGVYDQFGFDVNNSSYYQKFDALILFWLFKFRGKQEEFSIIIDGVAINEYLLRWSIFHRNENSVKYIFENLADEALKGKLVDITHFAANFSYTSNIVLYLFNRLSIVQFKEACIKTGYDFLKFFLHSTGKCDSFESVVKYVLKFIKFMDVLDAFRIIVFCWQKEQLMKEQYIYLWNEIANMSTVEINENYEIIFDEIFYSMLLTENDIESTKLLLNMGPSQAKEEIFNDFDEKWIVESFIKLKRFELFDLLINQMLLNEEDRIGFRRSFFYSNSVEICSDLIIMDDFNSVEDLVNRFITGYVAFERHWPHHTIHRIVRKILTLVPVSDGKQLKLLIKFINFSFKGNIEEINIYMSNFIIYEIVLLDNMIGLVLIQIDKLIGYKKWELVGKYLKLFFSASVRSNLNFKKDDLINYSKTFTKILSLSNIKNFDLMKTFIERCFDQTEFYLLLEELGTFENSNVIDQD